MQVLIVDDEPVARRRIRSLLEAYPEITLVRECEDGAEAVTAITDHAPDLVYLDVQMPELDGFEVIRAVGAEHMPAVVFVTAYDRYAVRAFEVDALDYLLKPFDAARFDAAYQRARRHLALAGTGRAEQLQALLDRLGPVPALDRFVVRDGARSIVVRTADIDWIEAADNYVRLHIGPRYYLLRGKISSLEARLDSRMFFRIHRSALVNVERVVELRSDRGGASVMLRSGRRLSVGETRRAALRARLGGQNTA